MYYFLMDYTTLRKLKNIERRTSTFFWR